MARPTRGQQRFRRSQVWQCRAASLAYQIERLNIGAQPEALAHITGEPGAEVAGAGADKNCVNLRGSEPGLVECESGGLPGEGGCVDGEAGMHSVGSQDERVLQIRYRQMAGF